MIYESNYCQPSLPPSLLQLVRHKLQQHSYIVEFYFRPKPLNSKLNAMTVSQHRLVVRAHGQGGMAKGGRVGKKNCAQTYVQSDADASSTHLQPTLALSGEELWQQEGRLSHCLKGGMLFLISFPRALSPGRNKALAPHWTEHTASLQHSRGTCGG